MPLKLSEKIISYSHRALPPNGLSPQSMVPRKVRLASSYDAEAKYFLAGGGEPSASCQKLGASSYEM